MGFHASPTEQQGHYRYDPTALDQQGPARIFPHNGEDGILRYIVLQLRHQLLAGGQLSQPLSLLLTQLESTNRSLQEVWAQVTTLLVNLEIFQSGWFNFDLPPNEQFNTSFVRKRRQMLAQLLAAKTAANAVIWERSLPITPPREETDKTTAMRSRFYDVMTDLGRSRPVVSHILERDGGLSDREFARQRLAGPNPMVIRQVQPTDRGYLESWAGQVWRDGEPLDLNQAAAAQRLFMVDYPLLQQLTPPDLQPGRYVGSPMALFYRTDAGLEPILIQIEQGQIVTPAERDTDRWMQAKLFVQTADLTDHELIVHLCDTHLAMEAFAIATPRQLPANHPVYRLLQPHFQFLLAINTRGNTILLGEGAAIDKLMAPTREASLHLINQAYRQRAFADYALPTSLKQRGVDTDALPSYPYRDDALLLWDAIQHYVTRYLQRYYPEDAMVQQDAYLQAWAAELGTPLEFSSLQEFPTVPSWLPPEWVAQIKLDPRPLPSTPRVPDFPAPEGPNQSLGQLKTVQQLIDIATQIIFTCGPQHAAVNFSQFDYVGYVPNAPLALYSRPDVARSVAQLLPSAEQDLAQIELAFALSSIQWGTLGSADLIRFEDDGDRQALQQFQADLTTIETEIKTRNQRRLAEIGVDYPYLLPSRIPNSINI